MDKLLEDLVSLPGVCGQEEKIRLRIEEEIKGLVDNYEVDNMGNLVTTIGQGEKHLIITAHMDEIGLVVTHIEEDGFLRIRKLGGVDPRTVEGRTMRLITKDAELPVAIAIKPPHVMVDRGEMKRTIAFEEMFVDAGATSREEAHEMGIQLFDSIVAFKKLHYVGKKFIMARSLDDRLGCWAMVKLLQELAGKDWPLRITFAWTVQEEIGLRGAHVLANKMNPDYVIALDTISSGDTPVVPHNLATSVCGKGPALRMVDSRCIASPWLSKFLMDLANDENIPIQQAVSGGTTDGAVFQTTGAHMVALSFPLRYTHAPCEMADKNDIENVVKLLAKVPNAIAATP
ncbi:M42 family metallopeptidase [Candidatus Uabimicrobium sp. HlEnr_7]|uniref:M42 family metallopeptidase n=1 Tax=Candidatus Uabimicrobium helgolandensis TaxID=3095367 RepID=UPI003558F41E